MSIKKNAVYQLSKVLLLLTITSETVLADSNTDFKNAMSIFAGVLTAGATAANGGKPLEVIRNGMLAGASTRVLLELIDSDDRPIYYDHQRRALHEERINVPYTWSGRRSHGEFIVLREGRHRYQKTVCREYRSTVYLSGEMRTQTSISCSTRNGLWQEVRVSDVLFEETIVVQSGPDFPEPPQQTYPQQIYPEARRRDDSYGSGYGRDRWGNQRHRWHETPIYTQSPVMDFQEFLGFKTLLKNSSFDSDRNVVVNQYVSIWQRRNVRLTTQQCSEILGTFEWDGDRMTTLEMILPIVFLNPSEIEMIVSRFDYSRNQTQARQLIVNHMAQVNY